MDVVNRWDEVPVFANAAQERQFWLTHRLSGTLLEEALTGGDQGESLTISLRMDPRMLARIKRLARSRYLNYQSMIKQWLSERLETELRNRGDL